MNTFEWHFRNFDKFVAEILSWSPDYLVPVARKGCKLLKTISPPAELQRRPDLIKYKRFFELTNTSVEKKKIAVLDDATQYTSTLEEYRRYFENLGATVRTSSFVGHEGLLDGTRWKEDGQAKIAVYLPEAVYQEYILQQSYHLLKSTQHFDLDHLVFEIGLPRQQFDAFLSSITPTGKVFFLEDYFLRTDIRRFSLDDVLFFNSVPFMADKSISLGPIRKIKFAYYEADQKLFFSPLVFPTWDSNSTQSGSRLFQNVPFAVPFTLPATLDAKNRSSLLRAYFNICFSCSLALAKSFVQEVLHPQGMAHDIGMRRNDLDAILGVESADRYIASATEFILREERTCFAVTPKSLTKEKKHKPKYRNIAEIIDNLKDGYAKVVAAKQSRIGVHYYLSYDHLFREVIDPTALSEDLDYYCDFGAIVPETVMLRGKITRACRSGETNVDYNWLRTRVLIPLAIDQFRIALGSQNIIGPTVLNKLLSNFAFDYPSQIHHELHCLIGEPYTFGTLMHVYHRHRAPSKPNIYNTERISPYYHWDKRIKMFVGRKPAQMLKELRFAFDTRQEVPFDEIRTYFTFLSHVYKHFRDVDVLNMLSICREQNFFYAHVLYNIEKAIEEFGVYLELPGKKHGIESLELAIENTDSVRTKLGFPRQFKSRMQTINARFESETAYVMVLEKINKSIVTFALEFSRTLDQAEDVVHLLLILKAICLWKERKDAGQAQHLKLLQGQKTLAKYGLVLPEKLESMDAKPEELAALCGRIYSQVRVQKDSLPAPEKELLASRLRNVARSQAKNSVTAYVYQNKLEQIVLLYMDLSGLRDIPEPKEDQLSCYYTIVEANVAKRGGHKAYGGRGGDDMFTILFTDVLPACQCALDIKKAFSEELFLRGGRLDVKFGMSYTSFKQLRKEQEIIQCWGNAKDCCELKTPTFRNRGDFLVSGETMSTMKERVNSPEVQRFVPLPGECLKSGSQLFRYEGIAPISYD
ncbi:MAG: hypothetical protein WC740_12870 [Verrucomicrobiia bacterium]